MQTADTRTGTVRTSDKKTFTEGEAIKNLANFLRELEKKIVPQNETEELVKYEASLLLNNLVFLGDKELKEGLARMAKKIEASLDRDEESLIFVPTKKLSGTGRSFKFFAKQLIELLEKNRSSLTSLKIVTDDDNFITHIENSRSRSRTVFLSDDFLVGGNQLQYQSSILFEKLLDAGLDPEFASKQIELMLIAGPVYSDNERIDRNRTNLLANYGANGFETKIAKSRFQVFNAPQPLIPEGASKQIRRCHSRALITSSWRDPDLGFGITMRRALEVAKQRGIEVPPLPVNIVSPYTGHTFQNEWHATNEKYGLTR